MKRAAEAAFVFAAFVLLWQAIVWMTAAPRYILPAPARVAAALGDNAGLIAWHAAITMEEVLIGLVIGAALGATTALCLAMSERASRFVLPVAVASQAIPVFALAPLLTLWLGYGLWSKVVMALLIIYFPVASTFLDGLRRTDPGLVDLARSMGAGKGRTLLFIRLPAALPAFASGLRLAAVYAPIGAVIGEWVGSSAGLGYIMLLANGRSETDLMFAALFVLAIFTLALHTAVALLARLLDDWSGGAGFYSRPRNAPLAANPKGIEKGAHR